MSCKAMLFRTFFYPRRKKMQKETRNTLSPDSFDLIDFTTQNIKHLAIITAIGAIISAIVAFVLPPVFKSSTTIYPTVLNPVSNHLFITNPEYSRSSKLIGEEEQVEQMIQILKSNIVLEKTNLKFDLCKLFDVDPRKQDLNTVYEDYVSIKKTELNSICISVSTHSPQASADIANFIASMADSAFKNITGEYNLQNLKTAKEACRKWEKRLAAIEDSLNVLGTRGLVDIETQTRELERAYTEALRSGKQAMATAFEIKLKETGRKAGLFRSLKSQLEATTSSLNRARSFYDAASADASSNTSTKLVVSKAYPSVKKSAPKRLIIILATSASTFFFALFSLLIVDFFKSRRQTK